MGQQKIVLSISCSNGKLSGSARQVIGMRFFSALPVVFSGASLELVGTLNTSNEFRQRGSTSLRRGSVSSVVACAG